MKTKYIKTTIAIASMALATSTSYAATVLNLTVDTDLNNTTAGGFGSNALKAADDSFPYNPDSPTTIRPEQSDVLGQGWHGDLTQGTHKLTLTLTGGALTTTEDTSIIYFDLYGRSANVNRDDNYTVTLYNGDLTNPISQLTGQRVAGVEGATDPFHNRSTFNLTSGVTFDRIQITAAAGAADADRYFSVMEVRAATVPEPSAAILSGLGVLALLRRRRLS